MRLVLGSRNSHKRRELEAILAPHELAPLPDGVELPPETGTSFADNALVKARATAEATGEAALGEDSGIVVPALGGSPGIRSARYAGDDASDEENVAKLLRELGDSGDRRAAYVCALAFAGPDSREELFQADCRGSVAQSPRGSGGFGYDPVFLPADGPDGLTMAELEPDHKNAISHRARAARLLLEWLSSRQ